MDHLVDVQFPTEIFFDYSSIVIHDGLKPLFVPGGLLVAAIPLFNIGTHIHIV